MHLERSYETVHRKFPIHVWRSVTATSGFRIPDVYAAAYDPRRGLFVV